MNVTFERRKALGLCPTCGENPPANNRFRCHDCLYDNSVKQKARKSKVSPQDNVKLALLSAKLAKASLEMLGTQQAELARLQFLGVVEAVRELDLHLAELQ